MASLVLCTVPDLPAALAELRRVVRPGGQLRFFEHVIARRGPTRAVQRVAGSFWPLICGGCHPDRDTIEAIARAGLELDRVERFNLHGPLLMGIPHVLGSARA